MKILAVDLGGSHAACALVDDTTILAREDVPIRDGALLEPVLPAIEATLQRLNRDRSAQDAPINALAIRRVTTFHMSTI